MAAPGGAGPKRRRSRAPLTASDPRAARARIRVMAAHSSNLQALALRLVAERVEAGGSISDTLADALAHEVDRHPEDAEELAAAVALAGGQVPDWHREILKERDTEVGGGSWDAVEARIRATLAARQRAIPPAFP